MKRASGTGYVYRPKYPGPDGQPRESQIWWLQYRAGGQRIRESSGTNSRPKAESSPSRQNSLGTSQNSNALNPKPATMSITRRHVPSDQRWGRSGYSMLTLYAFSRWPAKLL